MTQGLELGSGGAGELVRRERARSLGADVVVGIFRLVKLTQMHDLGNQATQRQVEELAALVHDYGLAGGCDVNILFARRAVFLAGQLLRAGRNDYEAATELGETLERLGGSELTIARDVTTDDLRAFAEAVGGSLRDRRAFRSPTPRIRLRAVGDAARVRGLEVETLTPEARLVRTYASAVVLLRRFFERLSAGHPTPPGRLKRVAQSLVDLSTGSSIAFLRVTEARNANFDDAGRSVNTAILAVAVAREVTADRAVLAQIAMASMMLDAGRPRAAASAAGAPQLSTVAAQLTQEQEEALPAGTAAVLTILGRLNDATIRRTVVAYEALAMRYAQAAGPLYGGLRPPTLHARIALVCRRYNDLLTPEPGLSPPTPEEAITTPFRERDEKENRVVLRLLASALGLFPAGTIVRLTSGAIGEIVAVPHRRASPDLPCVRIAIDAQGTVLESSVQVDLAAPGGDPALRIAGVVSVDGWGQRIEAPTTRTFPASEPPSGASSVSAVRSAPRSEALAAMPLAIDAGERTLVQRSPFEDSEQRTTFRTPTPRKVLRKAETAGEPTARGRLSLTPLVQLLVYMLDHRLSGSLVLREPDGVESTVIFEDGGPVKVSSGRPVARLGELLVELGLVARSAVAETVVAAKRSGALLGEALVERELLDPASLRAALTRQVVDKLVALMQAPPETTYAFYRDFSTLATWPTAETFPAHPLDAVLACVHAWPHRARIHATLARIAQVPLELSVAAELERVAFTDDQRQLVARMHDAKPTLLDLQRERGKGDETVASLVYVLAVTRQFAFLVKKGLPMGREHGEARPLSELGEGRISRVSLLPGDSGAPPSWPQLPSTPPAPIVTEKRASEPVRAPASARPAARTVTGERREQAQAYMKEADEALAQRDVAIALRMATRAALADPDNREARALVAWFHGQDGKSQHLAEALAELTSVLDDDPAHARALLYRGRLRKRAGKPQEAIQDFEAILAFDPEHREAEGELRQLRGKSS